MEVAQSRRVRYVLMAGNDKSIMPDENCPETFRVCGDHVTVLYAGINVEGKHNNVARLTRKLDLGSATEQFLKDTPYLDEPQCIEVREHRIYYWSS